MSQKCQVKQILPFKVLPKLWFSSRLTQSYMEKRISCCLSVSVDVCLCLMQLCKWIGNVWEYFGVYRYVSIRFRCSVVLRGVSEGSFHAGSSLVGDKPTKFGTTSKGKIVFSWRFQDIKISKPPYVSFPKIVRFCQFLQFWHVSQRNYNWQSFWITL